MISPSAVTAPSASVTAARAWIVVNQIFGARRHPADGTAEPGASSRRDDFFALERPLHAEAAADVRGDHAKLVLGESQDRREVGARQKRVSAS